jgi:formylglycine-generating enzyme
MAIRKIFPAVLLFIAATCARAGMPAKEHGPNGHVLVTIPAGKYGLGGAGNDLNPPHTVTLRAFKIADADTTNVEFTAFIKATGYVTDAERRGFGKTFHEGMADWAWDDTEGACWRFPRGRNGPKAADLPTHPVTQISGADAETYCRWIGGRLPTCDEWEAAARAGARSRYPWGDKFIPGRANIWNGATHAKETPVDGYVYTSPVRSYPPNAWGLYDVIGNVFQYCSDLPPALRGKELLFIAGRGGSWWCSANTCNSFNLVTIGHMDKHGSLANQGFRVVFDIPPAKSK